MPSLTYTDDELNAHQRILHTEASCVEGNILTLSIFDLPDEVKSNCAYCGGSKFRPSAYGRGDECAGCGAPCGG